MSYIVVEQTINGRGTSNTVGFLPDYNKPKTYYHRKDAIIASTHTDVVTPLGKLYEEGKVSLYQVKKNSFVVIYGMQVSKPLTYAQTCSELGECLMHASACNGNLDNWE